MSNTHPTLSERSKIETYLELGYSIRAIGKRMQRSGGAKSKLKDAIQEKLEKTWYPEQIVGRLYPSKLSFKSIYRWMYSGLLAMPLTVLRQKGKQQMSCGIRDRFNFGMPISKRPKEVRKQEIFDH